MGLRPSCCQLHCPGCVVGMMVMGSALRGSRFRDGQFRSPFVLTAPQVGAPKVLRGHPQDTEFRSSSGCQLPEPAGAGEQSFNQALQVGWAGPARGRGIASARNVSPRHVAPPPASRGAARPAADERHGCLETAPGGGAAGRGPAGLPGGVRSRAGAGSVGAGPRQPHRGAHGLQPGPGVAHGEGLHWGDLCVGARPAVGKGWLRGRGKASTLRVEGGVTGLASIRDRPRDVQLSTCEDRKPKLGGVCVCLLTQARPLGAVNHRPQLGSMYLLKI